MKSLNTNEELTAFLAEQGVPANDRTIYALMVFRRRVLKLAAESCRAEARLHTKEAARNAVQGCVSTIDRLAVDT